MADRPAGRWLLLLGSTLAAFEFWLFAALVPLIAPQFVDGPLPDWLFPALKWVPALLAMPLGAFWFARQTGWPAPTAQRTSLWLLALSSAAVALSPSALSALEGLAGAVWLLFLRLLQSLAMGGQLALALMDAQRRPADQRGPALGRWFAAGLLGSALAAASAWLVLAAASRSLPQVLTDHWPTLHADSLLRWSLLLALLPLPFLLRRSAGPEPNAAPAISRPASVRELLAIAVVPAGCASLVAVLGGGELGQTFELPAMEVWQLLGPVLLAASIWPLLAGWCTRRWGPRRCLLAALVLLTLALLPLMQQVRNTAHPGLAQFRQGVVLTLRAPDCGRGSECATLREHLLARGLSVGLQQGAALQLQLNQQTATESSLFGVEGALQAFGFPERARPAVWPLRFWLWLLAGISALLVVAAATLLSERQPAWHAAVCWHLAACTLPWLPAQLSSSLIRASGEPLLGLGGWVLMGLAGLLLALLLPAPRAEPINSG